ncbi:CDP-glycerol glycerophosphotransferase family protein [Bacteroides thetaiotaomicron]|uniref:CDP-glycerol glycerophosphotransferase family protein n=2 Tax=Bacteroides thetaiotaomicron TaxID=818 RepID=UPI002166A89F|nr:CDP-glycerol glycerophosphotransferase family protein [Bacteroides thetaiotaomicron]MCS2602516.1 CDP-glycerol glycerophosphotransferase family protein [Bacteroides thetaiotaomicron]
MRGKIRRYRQRIPSLEKEIFSKKKINVLFLVTDISMWKYDGLFKLLVKDSRFIPYIIPVLNPHDSLDLQEKHQKEMKDYFLTYKSYSFVEGYDFQKQEIFDPLKLTPDLIFYTQPYNQGYSVCRIEHLWQNALFLYTPYAFWIEKGSWGYNGLLHNIAWKLFYPTQIHLEHAQKYSWVKGVNVVVTGYPLADIFGDTRRKSKNLWKTQKKDLKKIIWAPHHSILKDDTLDYSNFLNIAEDMLNIASKYKDYIQIAFKPHPHLKRKLYKMQGWGIEKTNQYYLKWNELPNTILVEGDYIDLFMTSDAMIHDCSSFSVEYLYVNKPVLYLTKNNHLDFLCNFGEMAFNMHYKGSTVGDVEKFLKNVILDGCDSMKMQRNMFMIKYLLPSHGINVAENMFNEVVAPWNK